MGNLESTVSQEGVDNSIPMQQWVQKDKSEKIFIEFQGAGGHA